MIAVGFIIHPGSNVCRALHIKHTEPNDQNETMNVSPQRKSHLSCDEQFPQSNTQTRPTKTFSNNVLLMLPLSCLKCPVFSLVMWTFHHCTNIMRIIFWNVLWTSNLKRFWKPFHEQCISHIFVVAFWEHYDYFKWF